MTQFLTFPLYALGVFFGLVFTLLVIAVAMAVLVVHHVSFALCALGLHGPGCWIRRNMTVPVLVELRKLLAEIRDHARKKSGL